MMIELPRDSRCCGSHGSQGEKEVNKKEKNVGSSPESPKTNKRALGS